MLNGWGRIGVILSIGWILIVIFSVLSYSTGNRLFLIEGDSIRLTERSYVGGSKKDTISLYFAHKQLSPYSGDSTLDVIKKKRWGVTTPRYYDLYNFIYKASADSRNYIRDNLLHDFKMGRIKPGAIVEAHPPGIGSRAALIVSLIIAMPIIGLWLFSYIFIRLFLWVRKGFKQTEL
jgi:hypothetical protein